MGRTHPLEDAEILDIVGTDGHDSHHLPTSRPLTGTGYPPYDGGSTVWFGVAAMGDPVALRQEATTSGNVLEPV